jgi:group I intron endonuclease
VAFTLYCIQNRINGKLYIGKTVRPIAKRWKHHLSDHLRVDTRLYRAMRKYGPDNFRVIVLSDFDVDHDSLLRREIAYIRLFGTTDPKLGYNSHPGGAGTSHHATPQETRDKISRAHRGKRRSSDAKQKMSLAAKEQRRTLTDPQKAVLHRMTSVNTGRIRSAEHRRNNGLARRGKGKCYSFNRVHQKWQVRVTVDGKVRQLGLYQTEQEARLAAEAAKKEYYHASLHHSYTG